MRRQDFRASEAIGLRPRWLGPRLLWHGSLLGVVLLAALAVSCMATDQGTYVISATFNGVSRAIVVGGSSVEVSVAVEIVGSDGDNSWWCVTWYELWSPETQVRVQGCAPEPSPIGGCYCNWGCLTASWEWEHQFTTNFSIVVPRVAGTYDVTLCTLKQEEGCDAAECAHPMTFADAITVVCSQDDSPTVEAGSAQTLTCKAPTATISATARGGLAPYTYLWSPGGATTSSIAVTTPGTYTIQVTDANGCFASDSVTVAEGRTAPTVDAGDPQLLACPGSAVTLGVTVSGGAAPYSFLWRPGDLTTQTISVTVPETYTVQVTDSNGCGASDTVSVSTPEQGLERVTNGGFDQGLTAWRVFPDAGPRTAPVFSVSAFASAQDPGVPCMSWQRAWLQATATGTNGPAMLVQDVTALLSAGASYRLSCWMRSDAASPDSPAVALLYLTADGISSANGVPVEMRLPADRVPEQWTYCQSGPFVYALPSGCTQAWLAMIFPAANGTAWWAGLSLRESAG